MDVDTISDFLTLITPDKKKESKHKILDTTFNTRQIHIKNRKILETFKKIFFKIFFPYFTTVLHNVKKKNN